MIEMRDGSQVEDIKFGYLFQTDEQNYSAAPAVSGRKLKKRIYSLGEVSDQGATSMCTVYSLKHEFEATPVRITPVPDSFLRNLYCTAQKVYDPWEGDECGGSPSYGGTSILAAVKAAHKLGFFKEYRWARTTMEAAEAVGYFGPAILGTRWYKDMTVPDSDGFIYPTGNLQGGHAICIIGVDPEQKHFVLVNSWGPRWGKAGYCYLKFETMDKLFEQNAEVVFFLGRKMKHIS